MTTQATGYILFGDAWKAEVMRMRKPDITDGWAKSGILRLQAEADRDAARAEADRYKADVSGLRAELDALRGLVREYFAAYDNLIEAAPGNSKGRWEKRNAAEAALRAAVREQEKA